MLDIQVLLSSFMRIKTGLFSFRTFCCIVTTPISGVIDHYCIMENFKKSGENKNKLRIIYPKNHEKILWIASLGSNFIGSYKKKIIIVVFQKRLQLWKQLCYAIAWSWFRKQSHERKKIDVHMFLFPFLCSGITDLALGISICSSSHFYVLVLQI